MIVLSRTFALLVRKDMHAKEHERLNNITL